MTLAFAGALLLAVALHLAIGSEISLGTALALITGAEPEQWDEVVFVHAAAPRAAMAVLVGAALGLAGSVLQQVTRNRLASPLTIGASSGAWLALLAGGVFAPHLAAENGFLFAMGGAAGATALAMAIAGRNGAEGVPLVLGGMAIHILFGAAAQTLILLHGERAQNLFIWGAGDLTQTGWEPAMTLAPTLAVGLAIVLLCRRPLELMRIGAAAAAGRGLTVLPFVLLACLIALWMTAAAIAHVGIIGFIGLIAPNVARHLGARRAGAELVHAAMLGALALVLADVVALGAEAFTRDIVPTGASAALIGAPALILLALRRPRAADQAFFAPVGGLQRPIRSLPAALAGLVLLLVLCALFFGPTAEGWRVAAGDGVVLSLRWPRVMAALSAGAGMAVSGVILQRLLRNPLASPDIIGISSGASLALVAALVLTGISIREAGAPVALLGSLAALALLLGIARRTGGAPALMALAGISLAATLDAALRFVLARGGEDAYLVVGWLAGSTFSATGAQALWLLASIGVLSVLALILGRPLELLGAGDDVAGGRGLAVGKARRWLLALAATIAALVTSVVGPVAFVGLVAPHLASLLGARRARQQLIIGLLIGICLFVLSDWIGRTALYPRQLPAGAVASILGGAYLALLLARGRRGVAS